MPSFKRRREGGAQINFPVMAAMTSGEDHYATCPGRLRVPNLSHRENDYGAQRAGCTPPSPGQSSGASSTPPLLPMHSLSTITASLLTAANPSAHWSWHTSSCQNGKSSRFCLTSKFTLTLPTSLPIKYDRKGSTALGLGVDTHKYAKARNHCSHSVVPGPEALAAPGNLLEMHISGPHLRSMESVSHLCFDKPSGLSSKITSLKILL